MLAFVIAFSPDNNQQWLYLADGTGARVYRIGRSSVPVAVATARGGEESCSDGKAAHLLVVGVTEMDGRSMCDMHAELLEKRSRRE